MIINGDTLRVENAQTARLKLGITTLGGFPDISVPFLMDGGGAVIATGGKGWLRMPGNITITSWELVSDQAGSIVIDVQKSSYANYPAFVSIAGSDLPTLVAQDKNRSTLLTGWSRSLLKGDYLQFVVNSAATVERVEVVIVGTRTS